MTTSAASRPTFTACPSLSFRAEFGVCRGETIARFEDLNLGDIYLVKSGAKWMPVDDLSDDSSIFTLDLAANLPQEQLVTLAHLIFMTTTGRRADVFAAQSQGQLWLVTETPLQIGEEYVLIAIEKRGVEIEPTLLPSPHPTEPRRGTAASKVASLRLIS